MEHDARKMTALVLLLLLLGAGVVGVGYAAFSGQASTYNEANSATAGYIYLDSANWNAVTADKDTSVSTYTYNDSGSKVAYYLPSGDKQDVYGTGSVLTDKYMVAEIANANKDYTLYNESGEDITAITFKVTAPKITGAYDTSVFKYIVKVTSGSNVIYLLADDTEQYGNLTLSATLGDHSSTTLNVAICIGYATSTGDVYIPDSKIGAALTQAQITDAGKNTTDYDQPAKAIAQADAEAQGPIDLTNVDFAFTVAKVSA